MLPRYLEKADLSLGRCVHITHIICTHLNSVPAVQIAQRSHRAVGPHRDRQLPAVWAKRREDDFRDIDIGTFGERHGASGRKGCLSSSGTENLHCKWLFRNGFCYGFYHKIAEVILLYQF